MDNSNFDSAIHGSTQSVKSLLGTGEQPSYFSDAPDGHLDFSNDNLSQPPQLYTYSATTSSFLPTDSGITATVPGDDIFWDESTNLTLSNGEQVSGTFRQLYDRYPELRQSIQGYMSGYGVAGGGSAQPDATTDVSWDDFMDFEAEGGAASGEQHGHVGDVDIGQIDPELMHQEQSVESYSAPAVPIVQPADIGVETPVVEPPNSPDAGMETTAEANVAAAQPASPPNALEQQAATTGNLGTPADAPQYIPDIASFEDARTIVEGRDGSNRQLLSIPGDDVQQVKGRIHEYSKLLFDAFLVPGVAKPGMVVLPADAQEKFVAQQDQGLKDVQKLLKTQAQQKEARAQCLLLFEMTVFIHEAGMPKDIYDIVTTKHRRKSDRKNHLDLTSICSDRLAKMVNMVRDYKRVAVDVLKGVGRSRFAQDPDFYAEEKVTFLASNTTRQRTIDQVRKTDEELQERGVDSGANFQPPRTRRGEPTKAERKAAEKRRNEAMDVKSDDEDGSVIRVRPRKQLRKHAMEITESGDEDGS